MKLKGTPNKTCGLRVQLFKRGQWKARDKVKALKAGQTQRSGGSTSNKREKTETHVKAMPLEEVRLRLNVMTG